MALGLVLLTTFTFASASIDTNLKYGQKGTEVTELQDFLNDKGFLGTSPSGFFGLLTLRAVKAYQASKKLPSSGFVGPMTRESINREISVELADSTAAEIKEVGATTLVPVPVVQKSSPVVIQPVNVVNVPVISQVVTPVEENYTLKFSWYEIGQEAYRDIDGEIKLRSAGVMFTPIATLNNSPIEVSECWSNAFNENAYGDRSVEMNGNIGSKLIKGYGIGSSTGIATRRDVIVIRATSGNVGADIANNVPKTISCKLVNGVTVMNN